MPARKGGHEIFAEIGKTGLTNTAMRGIIYLAFAGVAHLVERDLAKVEVASSSLVARSKKKNHPLGGFSFWNAAGRMELAASTGAKRGEPFRRGRRPRRPVSAAVPRWERIPTSLRAAKQVPLGYTLAWQSVSKTHNSCTFPQIPS